MPFRVFEGDQQNVPRLPEMPEQLRGAQHLPAGHPALHLHQHLQHGHRVPRPAGDADEGGRGEQPGVQLHLHHRDVPQADRLWVRSVRQ